jgi:anaerobic magnesium-protoporphyrin IX monomethyl ester cyclase
MATAQSANPSQIMLITPPSVFLIDERVFVSLGILKVASSLEKQGVAVEHLDLNGITNFVDLLRARLRRTGARQLGITLTTPQLPSVVKIIECVRAERPDMRIILGGPHVTLSHSAIKLERRKGLEGRAHRAWQGLEILGDVLVSGDGELAVIDAMGPGAPKIIDADEPGGGYFLTNALYDETPLPARHLVDLSSYNYEIEGHRTANLIAQLGCPFGCGFCGGRNTKSLRSIRTRTTKSIIDEIRFLNETYGYTGFMFYDDELNVNKEMIPLMKALSELQEDLGIEFRFRGFVKAQLFTQEQAHAMFRAGFRWILVGFESGSPRILENINKRATVQDNDRAMEFAAQAGLKVKALMSLGHPGESEEMVEQTRDWLLTRKPDDFDCTIITTYPGTPYYDEAVPHASMPGVWTYVQPKTGDRLHSFEIDYSQVADYYKGDPNGGYRSYVFTDFLSPERLVDLRSALETSVRDRLKIPFPKPRPGLRYEHSMGQGTNLALNPVHETDRGFQPDAP